MKIYNFLNQDIPTEMDRKLFTKSNTNRVSEDILAQ